MTEVSKPNILVTGTPGAGKSYLCERLAAQLKFTWLDCSKIAKDEEFVLEYDEEYDCPVLDEDKLMDHLEPLMAEGGNIVEYHSCDFFPERWFQAVFVVTCPNTTLYDRLKARNYNEKKLNSNMQCEIFCTILDEARESYKPDIVYELSGETKADAEKSMKTVKNWYSMWKRK
ncbi:adenylate kinase isoenzyme 6 homolog [Drosophila nasuta]|uniref:Adenylate kinase isoenzyme 6 homolog n=1 Tax=Drosophila albomicans TaxID=7291 RepID=A0A6P8YP11_DROAB|nr:adenylate kinase isoenzyme 6 homolog [Drosophila albomicans]XP_060657290.1 adenylate kinase isoenzyme 6 homolog [Drosophila nasuta]